MARTAPSLPSRTRLKRALEVASAVRSLASSHPAQLLELSWDDFVAAVQLLTPQSYGNHIEAYLRARFGWSKLPHRLGQGDAFCEEVGHIEIKVSLITDHNPVANFVQLRPHSNLDAYCLVVIDTRDPSYPTTVFWLSDIQMREELAECGMVAHGRRRSGTTKRTEWVIRLRWDSADPNLRRWLETYSSPLARRLETCPEAA